MKPAPKPKAEKKPEPKVEKEEEPKAEVKEEKNSSLKVVGKVDFEAQEKEAAEKRAAAAEARLKAKLESEKIVVKSAIKPIEKKEEEDSQEVEDNVVKGGFGSAISELLQEEKIPCAVESIGWPDEFVDHASSVNDLRKSQGLDLESIVTKVLTAWEKADSGSARVEIN